MLWKSEWQKIAIKHQSSSCCDRNRYACMERDTTFTDNQLLSLAPAPLLHWIDRATLSHTLSPCRFLCKGASLSAQLISSHCMKPIGPSGALDNCVYQIAFREPMQSCDATKTCAKHFACALFTQYKPLCLPTASKGIKSRLFSLPSYKLAFGFGRGQDQITTIECRSQEKCCDNAAPLIGKRFGAASGGTSIYFAISFVQLELLVRLAKTRASSTETFCTVCI